jgi:hypothetical protein
MNKIIPLTCGKVAVVDGADFAALSAFRWHYTGRYAARRLPVREGGKIVFMHRVIAGLDSPCVDHANGNPLDNRRCNLRVCTESQNQANRVRFNSKSGLKGVSWIPWKKRWAAKITHNYRGVTIGYFRDKVDAARAYDTKAAELFGEFARTNESLGLLADGLS